MIATAKQFDAAAAFARAVIATLAAAAKHGNPLANMPAGTVLEAIYNDGFDLFDGSEICFAAFRYNGETVVRVNCWQEANVAASATLRAPQARALFAKARTLAFDPWRGSKVIPPPPSVSAPWLDAQFEGESKAKEAAEMGL